MSSRRVLRAALAAATCLAAATPAVAADYFSADLTGGLRHSDNIDQTATDERASGLYEIGTRLAFARRTSSTDVGLEGDLVYREFSDDATPSDLLTRFRGAGVWTISENRLYVVAQENLGDIGIGNQLGLTRADRERLNVFTVGPDWFPVAGDESRVRASARYSDMRYETSNLDGNRIKGELAYERSLAASSDAFVSAFWTHSEFDDPSVESNTTSGAAVGYQSRSRRTHFEAAAGLQRLQTDDGYDTGPYLRLLVERLVTPHTRLLAAGESRYGDASDAFVFGQTNAPTLGTEVSATPRSVPARLNSVSLGYEVDGLRVFASVSASYLREQDVAEAGIGGSRQEGIYASVGLRITPVISGVLTAQHNGSKPDATDIEVRDRSALLEFRWQLTRGFVLRANAERVWRTNSPTDFTENRYAVLFAWGAFQSGAPIDPAIRLRPRRGATVSY